MKDEKKYHGTVDKSSSEQQFHKPDILRHDYLCCVKIWSHTPSASGSYSRQSSRHPVRQNTGRFELRFCIVSIFTEINNGTVLPMH